MILKVPDIYPDEKEAVKQSPRYQSPASLLIIIALLIFVSEAFVMVIISFMRPLSMWFEAFFDAAMLVILISPALYFLEFRPLILHIKKRRQLENELRKLSVHDELTDLYNRRGFFTLAEPQLKLASRLKKEILLVFADIDGMKQINDTLGHMGGDEALIETADLFKEIFREADIIARVGGDEFVVLALETHDANADILSARLKENLKVHNAREGRRYKLTLSVGISGYNPENPSSIDELLDRADKLMYEQKRKKS